jgi:outer membrane protein assembly factor BamB
MAGSGRTSLSPVGDDEKVYLDSVHGFMGSPGRFAAVKAGASGDISLPDAKTTSSEFVTWSTMVNSYRNSSPLLHDGALYLVDQVQGIVRCYDAKTGKQRFQQRLPESAGFAASPWSNQGKIYLLDETGLTVVAEPGKELKIVASNRLNDDLFWASPAVHGNRLVIRGMQHLYCIGN